MNGKGFAWKRLVRFCSGVGVSHSVSSGLGEVRSGSVMYGMVLVQLCVVGKVRSRYGRATLLIVAFGGVLVKCRSTARI